MDARRLSSDGMHARGIRFDVLAIADQPAEKSQGHGTAANVAGADKQDVFHDDARRDGDSLRQGKIKRPQVNEPRRPTALEMTRRRFVLTMTTP
jgi:hypothetical protein